MRGAAGREHESRWRHWLASACAVAVVGGSLGSCAPAMTPESLSTPYQVAVGAYYAQLAGEVGAAAARATVTEALAADPTDNAIRVVLAQVELHDYVGSGSLEARERLIGQLVAVDASLRSGVSAADWVETRLFVTLGDLLMHDARRERQRWLDGTTATATDLWGALLRFDAAAAAYRYGRATGADEPSPGLIREREHAATALLASRLGLVAAIGDITISPVGALGRMRTSALQYFLLASEAEGAAAILTEPPARAAVSLDGDAHALWTAAFEALANDDFERLQAVCLETAEERERSEALDRFVDRLWRAARHAVLAETLGVDSDSTLLLALLEDFAARPAERACALDG